MKHDGFSVVLLIACCYPAAAQVPTIREVVSQATLGIPVSPGMPVVVNGTNLAGGLSDCPGPKVPLTCGLASVTVNNRAVPVRYAYPTQLVTYIPVDLAPGTVSVVVKNHLGNASAPFAVGVEAVAPGIQRVGDPSGSILGFFSDGSQRVINRSNPALAGQALIMYAVGLGPTNPVVPTGELAAAAMATLPTVWIGTRAVTPMTAGLGCGLLCEPGNYLVWFMLPPDTLQGDQQVAIEIGGKRSSTVTLVVGPQMTGPAVANLQSTLDASARVFSPGMTVNVAGAGFLGVPGGFSQCSIDPTYWPP